jgi:hypothetical protein
MCHYLWVSNCQFRFLGPFVLCRYGGVLLFLMEVSILRVRYPMVPQNMTKAILLPSPCREAGPSPGRSPVMADWFTFFHPWPTSLDMFGGFQHIYILYYDMWVCACSERCEVNKPHQYEITIVNYSSWSYKRTTKRLSFGGPTLNFATIFRSSSFSLENSSSNQRGGPNSCSLATPHMALLVSVCYCEIERSGVSAGVRLSECVPNFLHSSSKHLKTTGES